MSPTANVPEALRISTLAARTGTTAPTIRYYEAIGLLAPAGRQAGGQRRYGAADVRRLTFLRRCRAFGFSVDQVRTLATLVDDPARDCTQVRDLGRAHLDAVRAQLAELQALERAIAAFVERCETTCAGGPGPACVPLTQLADGSAPGTAPGTAPAGGAPAGGAPAGGAPAGGAPAGGAPAGGAPAGGAPAGGAPAGGGTPVRACRAGR